MPMNKMLFVVFVLLVAVGVAYVNDVMGNQAYGVHDYLMKGLVFGLYNDLGRESFSAFYHDHTVEFYSALIIFCILLTFSLSLAYLYRHTRQVKDSLIKSEKKLSDITSSLIEGIYVMDEAGRISFMNPAAERILGWTMQDLTNKDARNLFHVPKADGSHLSIGECGIHSVIRTGEPFVSADESFVRKDGTRFPISVMACPITENGKIVAVVTAFRDITERKRLEETLKKSEDKYRSLVENIPERIFLKDRNSVYLSCNSNYAQDLNISPSEIAGMTDYDLHPVEKAEKYRTDDKRVMETGLKEEFEEWYLLNGNKHYVHTIKTPVRDENGNVAAILGVFRDITKRKELEDEREKLISELRDALSKVKQLSGMLPICASCKKIRDDNGYWNQIEAYISDHSEALFSHGICPDCAKKLYPEIYDQIYGEDGK